MTLQGHSTEAVNRFPVNCIVGTRSTRCQKPGLKMVFLGMHAEPFRLVSHLASVAYRDQKLKLEIMCA
jgi:hypothetical protein